MIKLGREAKQVKSRAESFRGLRDANRDLVQIKVNLLEKLTYKRELKGEVNGKSERFKV